MAQNVGWRNFWWLNTALLALTTICCILLFPETKYNRHIPLPIPASSSPPLKGTPTTEDVENSPHHVLTHQDPYLGRGKPSKAQWKIAQPYQGNFFLELWMPWYLHLFPIVEFAAFVVSWSASGFLTLNLTQSQAFHAPPYNFTSTKIGFFNFAILIGALIGLLTAGPLSDFIAARLTGRNRGIREPEMRLLTMVPYVILMVIGNVVVAVGYERAWDWKVC